MTVADDSIRDTAACSVNPPAQDVFCSRGLRDNHQPELLGHTTMEESRGGPQPHWTLGIQDLQYSVTVFVPEHRNCVNWIEMGRNECYYSIFNDSAFAF